MEPGRLQDQPSPLSGFVFQFDATLNPNPEPRTPNPDILLRMSRNWLLAHWRRMAMQVALCALLAATIGLAALVTHQKRLALRLPLNPETLVGRLKVSLPRTWSAPLILDQPGAGDFLSVEEILPDNLPGRRLFIERMRTGRLLAPLEHLLRAGYLPEKSLASPDPTADPLHIQRLDVAGWPGTMVTRAIPPSGSRRPQKQVLACASLPPGQAVVIRLEGPGSPDDADEELVRQMAETVRVPLRDGDKANTIDPGPTGALVDLGGGVFATAPEHFYTLPPEANRSSRDLLADDSIGNWVAVELIPCLWFSAATTDESSAQQQVLALLAAHDRDWRSGPIKKMADGIWQVDRADSAATFPARAYCFTNGDDQAILAVMRGDWHNDRGFNDAWRAIYTTAHFTSHKDIPQLLATGRDEAKRLRDAGIDQLLRPPAAHQSWSLWDQAENVDKQLWMQIDWGLTALGEFTPAFPTSPAAQPAEPSNLWHGSRRTWPERLNKPFRPPLLGPYALRDDADAGVQQLWSGSVDLSRYLLSTDRFITDHNQKGANTRAQRWELRDGNLQNLMSTRGPQPVPDQYVPGAWLPLIFWQLAGSQPMLLKTESFLACDGIASDELLTLYVAPVPDTPMTCVAVTVNGTGRVTRFWYATDGSLRYIDFAGNLRAQRDDKSQPPAPR